MKSTYNYISAEEALSVIQSGDRVFIHGSACTPLYLLRKLAEQSCRLKPFLAGVTSIDSDFQSRLRIDSESTPVELQYS